MTAAPPAEAPPTVWTRPRPIHWVWLALCNAALTWVGYVVLARHAEDSQSWFPPVIGLALAAVSWPHLRRRECRPVAITAGTFIVTGTVGAVLGGESPWRSVHMSVISLVVGGLVVAAWLRLNSGHDFEPGGARDVVVLSGLLTAAAFVTVAAGGIPHPPPGLTHGRAELLWVVRIASNLIVTTPFVFIVVLTRGRGILPSARPSPANVAMGLLSLLSLVLPYLVPKLPLGWAVFIAVIWAGLTLTPRLVAGLILIAPGMTLVGALLPYWRVRSEALIPPATMMQALAASAATVALLIVYQRVDNERLTQQLNARLAAASRHNALLTGVFRTMREGLLVASLDGTILRANPAARSLLGHRMPATLDPAAWAATYDFRAADDSTALTEQDLAGFLSPGDHASAALTLSVGAQDRKVILDMHNEIIVHHGNRQRLVLLRDITASRERQQHLKAFAATVAHDLKNPLASVVLWMDTADTSLADGDREDALEAVQQACEAAEGMNRLIDDYLAYTVSREGASRPVPTLLAGLIDDLAARHDPLRLTVTHAAPQAVTADRTLLRQLLANLLDNAMKYARPGTTPTVHITSRPDPSQPGWVTISVADRGIGLAPGSEASIFEPFTRSHRGLGPGAGLGLAICRTVVERHGGSITAGGNEDGGTTIRFSLPDADPRDVEDPRG